jgi:hypothetical protein
MDYKEIIKARIEELPRNIKDFVISQNWRDDLNSICKKYQIDEEKIIFIENEVFLTIIGFQKIDNLEESLSGIGLGNDNIKNIVTEIKNTFISSIVEDINELWHEDISGVGDSFERIIENQARAMQPALESLGDIKNVEQKNEERVLHNYTTGTDPYREPVE